MAGQHLPSRLAERRALESGLWLSGGLCWFFGPERIVGRDGVNVRESKISPPNQKLTRVSSTPIAGGQYHWTAQFAPKRYAVFISWIQGKARRALGFPEWLMIGGSRRLDHRLRMASNRDERLLPDGGPDQRGHHLEPRKLQPQGLASDTDYVGHHRPDAGDQYIFHPDLTAHREPGGDLSYSLLLCLADSTGVPRPAKRGIVRIRLVREQRGMETGRDFMVCGIADRRVSAGR